MGVGVDREGKGLRIKDLLRPSERRINATEISKFNAFEC